MKKFTDFQLLRKKNIKTQAFVSKKTFDKFSDYQDSDGRNEIDTCLIKQFTTSEKHPIGTKIRILNL